MRTTLGLLLLLTLALAAPVLADIAPTMNVPPYSLSIVNVVVRPNEMQTNVAKGLYLKGGYVLTAFHVGEKTGNNTRYLSTKEYPMIESMQIVDDVALDFSILLVKDLRQSQRFTQYFGSFGSTDLQAGDTVYYFKNNEQSQVRNEVFTQKILEPRNAAGRILMEGGVPQGYSGSPVFSSRTHKLVGMIIFGDDHMTELSPIEDILDRVRKSDKKAADVIVGP